MASKNYLLYLNGTIDTYPLKVIRHLNKLFENSGLQIEETACDPNDRKLSSAKNTKLYLSNNANAISLFEKWEFEKDYKYSVIFTCDKFSNLVNDIDEKIAFLKDDEDEYSKMADCFEYPTKYSTDEFLILKFSLKFAAFNPLNANEIFLKYPLLIVFHKKIQLVEIRFDTLKRIFISERKEQTLYPDFINNAVNYLYEKLNSLRFDTDYIRYLSIHPAE